jgi:hypothetical protein
MKGSKFNPGKIYSHIKYLTWNTKSSFLSMIFLRPARSKVLPPRFTPDGGAENATSTGRVLNGIHGQEHTGSGNRKRWDCVGSNPDARASRDFAGEPGF